MSLERLFEAVGGLNSREITVHHEDDSGSGAKHLPLSVGEVSAHESDGGDL